MQFVKVTLYVIQNKIFLSQSFIKKHMILRCFLKIKKCQTTLRNLQVIEIQFNSSEIQHQIKHLNLLLNYSESDNNE